MIIICILLYYMHEQIYVCAYASMHMLAHMSLSIHVHVYISVYADMCLCMCAYVHEHVYVCLFHKL